MTHLLGLVGRGTANVSTAASIARTAVDEGLKVPALERLAKVGACGEFDNNAERDVHRLLKGLWGMDVEPYDIRLHLQVSWILEFKVLHLIVWFCLFLFI